MTVFWLLAAIMLVVSVGVIVVPLLRSQDDNEAGAGRTPAVAVGATAAVLTVPVLALVLYNFLTTWDWDQADAVAQSPTAPSVQEMVSGLERRLREGGGEVGEWVMLGRSYVVLGQYDKARDAYAKAYELDEGATPEVTSAYAEALILADAAELQGLGGRLLEEVLAASPGNQKALWWGGMAAYQRRDWAVAAERWTRLKESGPPAQVQQMLAQRIAEVEQRLGGTTPVAPPATASAPVTAAGPTSVELDVSIAPELAAQVDGAAPLFIIARNTTAAGPPLAVVRRRSAELPLKVELSDADAMIPGTKLSTQSELKLVARVALGGSPLPQPGDLFGEIQYRFADGSPVALRIDSVVQ